MLLRSTAFTAASAGCDLSNRRRRRRDDGKLVATERRLEAWAWLVAEDTGVQTSQVREKKDSVGGQTKGTGEEGK